MHVRPSALVVATTLAIASTAHATPAADPVTAEPTLAPAAPLTDQDRHMMGARWSTKRLVGEILAGAVIGSLTAYGTYSAMCGDDSDCFGASLMAAGMNFAITPLAVWGTGRMIGGQGSLGWSYLGGVVSLAAFSATGPADESTEDALNRFQIELTVATILLPIASAVTFELSSHLRYKQWQAGHPTSFQAGIVPAYDLHRGLTGALGQVSLRF